MAKTSEADEKGGASSATPRELELLEKLQAAEKAALDAEAQLQAMQSQDSSGLRIRSNARGPYRGENGGWKFRIGPVAPQLYKHLEIIELNACDESELIRWYCETHQDPPGSGRQVDPVKVKLRVECLDPGRSKLTLLKQQLAAIRIKLQTGAQLNSRELDLLEKHEAEITGIAI